MRSYHAVTPFSFVEVTGRIVNLLHEFFLYSHLEVEYLIILEELFVVICGLLATIRPEIVWTIKESWKSNDATEPSDLYL
jgi:hypothetical protein